MNCGKQNSKPPVKYLFFYLCKTLLLVWPPLSLINKKSTKQILNFLKIFFHVWISRWWAVQLGAGGRPTPRPTLSSPPRRFWGTIHNIEIGRIASDFNENINQLGRCGEDVDAALGGISSLQGIKRLFGVASAVYDTCSRIRSVAGAAWSVRHLHRWRRLMRHWEVTFGALCLYKWVEGRHLYIVLSAAQGAHHHRRYPETRNSWYFSVLF